MNLIGMIFIGDRSPYIVLNIKNISDKLSKVLFLKSDGSIDWFLTLNKNVKNITDFEIAMGWKKYVL